MSGSFGPSQNTTSSAGSINLSSPGTIGDVLPAPITSTDLTVRGKSISVPSLTQNIFAGTTPIQPNADLVLISPGSSILMTYPGIAAGTNGQVVTVYNSGVFGNNLIFNNSSGVKASLNSTATVVIRSGMSCRFRYYSSTGVWLVDGDNTDSVDFTGLCTGPSTSAYLANSNELATRQFLSNHLYNHDQPGWRNLTLTANWVNFSVPTGNISIKRIGRDMVQVRGIITVQTSFNAIITTIPIDCRTTITQNFAAYGQTGANQVSLSNTGVLSGGTALAVGQFLVVNFTYFL